MHCKHTNLRYVRNGQHISTQCADCGEIVKAPEHGGRLYIKRADVPRSATIYPMEVRSDDN